MQSTARLGNTFFLKKKNLSKKKMVSRFRFLSNFLPITHVAHIRDLIFSLRPKLQNKNKTNQGTKKGG
jgi:hypothetical protein